MRTAAGFAFGFAAGVFSLAVFLYATGRIRQEPASAATPAVAALPTPAAADTSMPKPLPVQLPTPPDMPTATIGQGMGLPIAHLTKEAIRDTFDDTRGGGTKHEATDILAPRNTPVLAVVEGNVVKLFNSKKGGITVYEYDNNRKYCYYYAHLDHYSDGLKEGMLLRKGDTLGYVGSTGDAQPDNPHLHFAILELGPDKHWYEHTTAINPYPLLIHALALP